MSTAARARTRPARRANGQPWPGRPPGPHGSGWTALARYLRDPLTTLEGLPRAHGDVAAMRLGNHDFVFVNDPAAIRRILVRDHRNFVKGRSLVEAKRLLGEGLLTSEGATHLRNRRLAQPIFHHERIAAYGEAMTAEAVRAAERWRDGAEVDANAEMTRLALAVVGRTIFDADVESEASEIREVLEAGMQVFHRFLLPGSELLWRLPLPATRRFLRARERMDAYVYRLIDERRSQAAAHGDVLAMLLAARGEDGETLSQRQVRDEAITLMLAGHETTAQALTWAWYLLAHDAAVERRLHEEVDALGGRPPTVADLPRLRYAEAVVAEALRLYPPVWALARRAIDAYDLDGHAVPAGCVVVMSQYVVQRDRRWFPEPLRFRPERWLDGEAERSSPAYFPFGGGPRLCIGERFAWMEAVLVLATLAARFRLLDRRGGQPPALDPRFTLRPRGGLPVRLERRGPHRRAARPVGTLAASREEGKR